MAVAGEQSCLKLTFVSLVIDPAVYRPSPAVRQWIGVDWSNTSCLVNLIKLAHSCILHSGSEGRWSY